MRLLRRTPPASTHTPTGRVGDMAYYTCTARPGEELHTLMRNLSWRCEACGGDVTAAVRQYGHRRDGAR